MKKITGYLACLSVSMMFTGVIASAEPASSVKINIGKITVTNPHPKLKTVEVKCNIAGYKLSKNGARIKNSYWDTVKKLFAPFDARNLTYVKKFNQPVYLEGGAYTCKLVGRGVNGSIQSISTYSASGTMFSADKCIPQGLQGGGKGECAAFGYF